MIKTKLGIDKILTINLPKRKDRRKSFNDKFQTMEFDFVDAVDGSKLDTKKLIKSGKISETHFDPQGSTSKYVIGCSLSHLLAWETFNKSKDETCLIFEDDVYNTKKLVQVTTDLDTNGIVVNPSQLWNDIWSEIQELEWDVIYLGKKQQYVNGEDVTNHFCKPFWGAGMFGAHSYLINKKSVKKLIKRYKPIQYAVDVFLDLMIEDMNVFALKESLFRQDTDIYLHDRVNIDKVDSDTFHNNEYKLTKVQVDDTVESVDFINYPNSDEYTDKRWPPLIRLNLRK